MASASRASGLRRWLALVGFLISGLATASPAGSLSGRALDGAGQPLAGVRVELAGPVVRSAETDTSGRYEFDGLPAGSYTLSLETPLGRAEAAIEVAGNEAAIRDLSLSAPRISEADFRFRRRARGPRRRAGRNRGRGSRRDPRHQGQQLQGRLRPDAGGPRAAALRGRRKPVLDPGLGPAQQLPRPRGEPLRQRNSLPGRRRILGLRGPRVHGGEPRGGLEGRERAALRREHVRWRRQPGHAGPERRFGPAAPDARRVLRLLQGAALVGRPPRSRT